MPGVGTTHHILLGTHYYMVRPGSYSQRVAPQFGARFTTGDPDYNNLSLWQHWAQKCFVGGMDAEEFADDAMYDDGVGVNTTEHEKVTLARDLRRGTGANWTVSAGSVNGAQFGARFCVYNNVLYYLTFPNAPNEGHLWKYVPGTDGWTRITSLDGQNIIPRSIQTFDGKLFIGGQVAGGSAPKLIWGTGTLSSWTVVANPSGVPNGAINAMRAFQRKMYVAFNTDVWRMKEDQTWDGNTVFYKANMNSDSNYIVAMETHLGFLYMLSRNAHIHRTDGNATFDIWSWDGQTIGVAIRSFDGRLFVAVNEYSDPAVPTDAYGALYQMSGSAVTQLKRWGKAGEYTGLGSLIVHDRKMFYGASNLLGMRAGFGLAVYDPIEDAHSVFASNGDTVTYARGAAPYTNYGIDDAIYFAGKFFVAQRGSGAFYVRYSYRDRIRLLADYDTTAAGVQAGPQNGGWFTSSTYDAGTPGLLKLWRKVIVDYELPHSSTALVVEYSTNNGTSWTALTTVAYVAAGRRRSQFFLNNIQSVSFKLRVTLRSTNSIYTPIFYGWVVSYLPIIEPNWLWTFTIVLAEKVVLLDGTTETVDTEAEMAYLKGLFRTKQLVNFTDMTGAVWASDGQPGVLIYDMDVRLLDGTQPLEGEVVLTLLEAVETY